VILPVVVAGLGWLLAGLTMRQRDTTGAAQGSHRRMT
jgi:hypothetical protein